MATPRLGLVVEDNPTELSCASIETILYHTELFLAPVVMYSYWGCDKSFIT